MGAVDYKQYFTHAEVEEMRRTLDRLEGEIDHLKRRVDDRSREANALRKKLSKLEPDGVRFRRARHGSVRDLILQILTEQPSGLPLSELVELIGARFAGQMHPRTPSMVLDRLRREGIVHQSGRLWLLSRSKN